MTKCAICGGNLTENIERKQARYRGEIVEVQHNFFRCEACKEEYVTPEQMRTHVRAVKNEVRKKYGLLSPERVKEIREKLRLTQEELEELLGTGPKVVVRWESGKVIQGSGQDNMLRLLEREPGMVDRLRQIAQLRSKEQKEYSRSHSRDSDKAVAQAV